MLPEIAQRCAKADADRSLNRNRIIRRPRVRRIKRAARSIGLPVDKASLEAAVEQSLQLESSRPDQLGRVSELRQREANRRHDTWSVSANKDLRSWPALANARKSEGRAPQSRSDETHLESPPTRRVSNQTYPAEAAHQSCTARCRTWRLAYVRLMPVPRTLISDSALAMPDLR